MLRIDGFIDNRDVKSISQEQYSGATQMERVSIPTVTYASIQVTDGNIQIAEGQDDKITRHTRELTQKDAADEVLSYLKQIAQQHNLQVVAATLQEEDKLKDVISKLWLQEDIVPFIRRRQDAAQKQTLEEQVRAVASHFDKNHIVHPHITVDREVEVAELVTLEDYRKTASPEDFALVTGLAEAFKGKRLVFISATPQGGGVALMRHALIRLLRLLQVDAHWYVLIPEKEAFDITKTKFHNVLQAVANPQTELTAEDKAIYEDWMKENASVLQPVFQQADVMVIDDPQPSGLIPYIRVANPDCKIIYRSHIQIVGRLASQAGTPQHTTWSFLWNNIQHADYFVSHPMKIFIPEDVPAEKIFYMPATTDPLDGLNKPLTQHQMSIYLKLFNALLLEDGQTPLDEERAYIIQIARFDPSKGIPDVVEAYRKLRYMLQEQNKPVPQLVITGNGSIDDPDGVRVYSFIKDMLKSEFYAAFADDVKVLRLPHRDQMLNTLL